MIGMKEGIVASMVVTSFLALGCAAGMYRTPAENNALMDSEQIVLKGFSNAVTLSAVRAKADRLESGNLRVRVQLYKESLGEDFVEIMTTFVGADGFHLEQTNWEPLHMGEGIVTQYETSSLSSEAVDFRLVVRVPTM